MARKQSAQSIYHLVWDCGDGPEILYTTESEGDAICEKHRVIREGNGVWPWIVRAESRIAERMR